MEENGNLLKDIADKNSSLVETDKEKAEVLAEYFSSVFIKEPPGPVPTLPDCKTPTNPMIRMDVTEEDIKKILEN